MNLTSCDTCGVVLDKSALNFPEDIYDEYGTVDKRKADWDGDEYRAYVRCPVCGHHIYA